MLQPPWDLPDPWRNLLHVRQFHSNYNVWTFYGTILMTKSMAEIAEAHVFLPFMKWMQNLHKQTNDCEILTVYSYT